MVNGRTWNWVLYFNSALLSVSVCSNSTYFRMDLSDNTCVKLGMKHKNRNNKTWAYRTIVRAVTAYQEVLVKINIHTFSRKTTSGIIETFRKHVVNRIHTLNWCCFLPIWNILQRRQEIHEIISWKLSENGKLRTYAEKKVLMCSHKFIQTIHSKVVTKMVNSQIKFSLS